MSKRRRAAAPYYVEWHITRTEEEQGVPQEWYVDVPMPLQGAPSGLYWAIELRSVIYKIGPMSYSRGSGVTHRYCHVACTSSPRSNKTPFITGPSHPDNIWWYDRDLYMDKETFSFGAILDTQSRNTNKCDLTDHKGTGKLLAGPHIFIQLQQSGDAVQTIELCFEYNYTLIKCQQMLGVYQGRLSEA